MFKLIRFLFLNVLQNGFDQTTDFFTFWTLYHSNNINWAALTLTWMFAPLIIHVGKLLYFSLFAHIDCTNVGKEGDGEAICKIINSYEEFKTVVFQVPFGVPLRNLYHFVRLCRLGYDTAGFDPKDSKEVEDIFNEVGELGLYESFFEAGPQSVTQTVIIFCTGEMSTTQVISIMASLASLGWGASRAFFLTRKRGHIDPEPPLRMMRIIFPLMIIVVTNNMIMWTFIGGLLSRATPVAIIINFFTIFSALRVLTSKPENSTETFVVLRASVFAIWLPCVVSDRTDSKKRPNLFLITAFVTLATKIMLLGVAFVVTYFNTEALQEFGTKPFVLWCVDREYFETVKNMPNCSFTRPPISFINKTISNIEANSEEYKGSNCTEFEPNVTCTFDVASEGFFTFDFLCNHNCFESFCVGTNCPDIDGDFSHKMRICDKGENKELYRILFYIILLSISNLAAFLASLRLQRISDYKELYEASKNFLKIYPITPYIHRSHLFELVNERNAEELEKVLHEDFGSMAECVNRTNHKGDTLLHDACRQGCVDCVAALLMAGAQRKQNSPTLNTGSSTLSSAMNGMKARKDTSGTGRVGPSNSSAAGLSSGSVSVPAFPNFAVLFSQNNDSSLKRLAYRLIEAGCEGKQAKRDIWEIMDFEEGKLLGLVDNPSKRMVQSWAHPGMKHYLENPDLLDELLAWHKDGGDLKFRREQNILGSLRGNRGSLIPIDGISKHKRRGLKESIRAWNKKARGRKCRLICDNSVGEANGWSDRRAAKSRGPLSGLEVKHNSHWVCQIRARYGSRWASWHYVGPDLFMAADIEKSKLLLDGDERIYSVSGFSREEPNNLESFGWIEMIKVETSHRVWGPFGDSGTYAMPNMNWEEKSPETEGAQLSHLSGHSRKGAIELCFHWVVPNDSLYDRQNYV